MPPAPWYTPYRAAFTIGVRTVVRDGDVWFVAKDVCDVLEIHTSAVSRRLDEDEKFTLRLAQGESNRTSNVVFVNESGLYSLILGSRKPEAKAFKRWVTHEVLRLKLLAGQNVPIERRIYNNVIEWLPLANSFENCDVYLLIAFCR